jgi:hypothetical protein
MKLAYSGTPMEQNAFLFDTVFHLIQLHISKQIPLHSTSRGRDSAVGMATGYGLDGRGAGVGVPVGVRFSSLHVVQTGSEAHPASYSMGTGGSFPGRKAAGV